jgi:ElaB/YqjD/DUF883 family membrane-anchored ribosome-binding protein
VPGTIGTSSALLAIMNTEAIHNRIHEGTVQLQQRGRAVVKRTRQAMSGFGDYVHENPWVPIGIVAGIALLVGVLVASRQR